MEFNNVRIEELLPFQKEYGQKTGTIWISDGNVEESIRAVEFYGIEHIHLQTKSIDFLNDKRLSKVKGISIQYEVDDINPLLQHAQLTHLGIQENINVELDFKLFKNLIFLSGRFPKKYKNFQELEQLQFTHLSNYKKKDFTEFSACENLKTLEVYSSNCETLEGLSNLTLLNKVKLTNFRRLESLKGLEVSNKNIEKIFLVDCKLLKDISYLKNVPNLKYLQLYNTPNLDSLEVLNSLNQIQDLYIHPKKVKVKQNDYNPLVNKLKKLDKLDYLNDWKPLDDYLNNRIELKKEAQQEESELTTILKNLSVRSWTDKLEYGLEQYSKENCEKAVRIFEKLIDKIDSKNNLSNQDKIQFIKTSVLEFNLLNEKLDYSFIETGEREELCTIFDNIADAIGIDVSNYEDGIASEWRDW